MSVIEVSKIQYSEVDFKSFALLDNKGDLRIAPTLFLADLSVNGYSQETISNYAYRLDTFLKVIDDAGLSFVDVDQQHIDLYLNKFLNNHLDLEITSINGHIACLSKFFEHIHNNGFVIEPKKFIYRITDNDTGYKIKSNVRKKIKLIEHYLSREQFDDLLSYVSSDNDYINERDELILNIGYHMGLRAREVVDNRNLTLTKLIDKKTGEGGDKIKVIGKGEKLRTVLIPPELKNKIKSFIDGRRKNTPGNILICAENGNQLNKKFASGVFSKAALTSLQSIFISRGFHSLRHTYATNCVIECHKNGYDPWTILPDRMGHEDKATTFLYIFFEAVLNSRHSLIKKLSVKKKSIFKNKKTTT